MDQLKIFLAAVKKDQFWVLCGIMLCISLGCWFWATGDLADLFQKQKSAVKNDFTSVQHIQRGHANDSVIEYVRGQTDKLKQGVFAAWETLYNQQKANNPFPVELLGKDFKNDFERLQPNGELLSKYRERYRTFIPNYLNNLKIEVDAHRPDDSAAANTQPVAANGNASGRHAPSTPGSEAAANVKWIGTVDWNSADYDRLERRFDWPQPPTTQAVVFAQEDLWVYEALLRVIHGVNETGLAVTRIEAIDIGKDAVKSWRDAADTVVRDVAAAAGPATGPGGPGGDQNDSNRLLLENRYIDDKGQPLSSIPPDSEFKLMPIRLSLVMNQLRLPSLLAECANSSMPIEVRRVRICKSQSTPLELATAASAAPSDARRGFRMQPRESVHRSSQESGGGPSQELGPEDVPVEIYGVIYIFNPPNREKFGVGAAPARSPTVPPADMPGARPSSPLSPPKK